MPIHDWARVEAGIFHDFHHSWITELARALNHSLLPSDHYALVEHHAACVGPPVPRLQEDTDDSAWSELGTVGGVLTPPRLQPIAETDLPFYRRKQSTIVVRHVSGDRIVAMVEVVSPGNKASRNPLRAFVAKAAELLDKGVHLVILDLLPPGKRDSSGIHSEIWEEIAGAEQALPADKPLTLASYESNNTSVRAFVVHAAVGDALTGMPLFLAPGQTVEVPLEATYQRAFAAMPQRWRRVLERTP
jgi:hypothetical protein